jgi:hypothetical protein
MTHASSRHRILHFNLFCSIGFTMIHARGLGVRMAPVTQPLNAKPSQAPTGGAVLQDMEFAVCVSCCVNTVFHNIFKVVEPKMTSK